MTDLRCQCGHKLAEYTDTEVRIMDKKCKSVTTLRVVDGKLATVGIDYAKNSSDESIEIIPIYPNEMMIKRTTQGSVPQFEIRKMY